MNVAVVVSRNVQDVNAAVLGRLGKLTDQAWRAYDAFLGVTDEVLAPEKPFRSKHGALSSLEIARKQLASIRELIKSDSLALTHSEYALFVSETITALMSDLTEAMQLVNEFPMEIVGTPEGSTKTANVKHVLAAFELKATDVIVHFRSVMTVVPPVVPTGGMMIVVPPASSQMHYDDCCS